MIPLPLAAALAAAVLSTSFISGIFGMAGGMILMGVLLAIMPLTAAMVLHGVTQTVSNSWRAWLWRDRIEWRVASYYLAGTLVAAVAFVLAPIATSKPIALVILGLMPLVGLALPKRLAPDAARPWHGFASGAICTVLQLLCGISGPILDLFFVRSHLDRRQTVATKAAVQAVGHVLKVVYFGQLLAAGEGVPEGAIILAVILAVLGTHLSRRVLDAISDAQFRAWSKGLIVSIAVFYLVQGVVLYAIGVQAEGEAIAEALLGRERA
jgi:uncharacterized protein